MAAIIARLGGRWSWATFSLAVFCALVAVPVAVALNPDVEVTVAGQRLGLGAREPDLSVSGPAQLVQIGNTEIDLGPLRVVGPLRPRITLGPVQRNADAVAAVDPANVGETRQSVTDTLTGGFLEWYGWGALLLLAITLAATALVAYVLTLVILRTSRDSTVHEVWQRSAGQIRSMTLIAVATSMLVWGACGALAYNGAVGGLRQVGSLADLVGTFYVPPAPVGATISGYQGAVIGDSRVARLGGPGLVSPSDDDTACGRSSDSMADQLGRQLDVGVLNLACSGASIASGLRGEQSIAGRTIPAQVGLLQQVEGLRFVVVAIGPNDLNWGDLIRYCYAVANCQDNLTNGEFAYRLADFDRDYADLLHDLNDLPGSPQVIIMTSYDVFDADVVAAHADCADARGPEGAHGLTADHVRVLADRNRAVNDVLVAGAGKYGFDVASPRLTTLCDPAAEQWGADIEGLSDRTPFHPTATGIIRLAATVARVVH